MSTDNYTKPSAKSAIARRWEFIASQDYLEPHFAEIDGENLFSCRAPINSKHSHTVFKRANQDTDMRHGEKSCLTFSIQNTLGNLSESSLSQILKIIQYRR